MITLCAHEICAEFDPSIGLLKRFIVTDNAHTISPLHTAPWVDSNEVIPANAAPHLAKLGGDFFCAPFGATESSSPLHGWPPNSPWIIETKGKNFITARLGQRVFGAELMKELTLKPGHPFVYQRHTFIGGLGQVSVANHANVSLPNGGYIRTSPKFQWRTPPDPLETDPTRGRSSLAYSAQAVDPKIFPTKNGTADLTKFPWMPRHEEFVAGLEKPGNTFGWTAITRPSENDLFLSLRNTSILPMTMFWHSNGGRDYAPWSGRHTGCLGVEEGAAARKFNIDPETRLSGPGEIQLTPESTVVIPQVIGAIHWPSGSGVKAIEARETDLKITGEDGDVRYVLFDRDFLSID